jgi:hypothetical protein
MTMENIINIRFERHVVLTPPQPGFSLRLMGFIPKGSRVLHILASKVVRLLQVLV